MKGIKQVIILGLSIAVFSPIIASAATWTLPSGAVYDDTTNQVVLSLQMQIKALQAQIDILTKKSKPPAPGVCHTPRGVIILCSKK